MLNNPNTVHEHKPLWMIFPESFISDVACIFLQTCNDRGRRLTKNNFNPWFFAQILAKRVLGFESLTGGCWGRSAEGHKKKGTLFKRDPRGHHQQVWSSKMLPDTKICPNITIFQHYIIMPQLQDLDTLQNLANLTKHLRWGPICDQDKGTSCGHL